ncbi:hypothetical protein A2165_03810 [Candidatus Curtissbacteria bacterium RBG_13_40_7]|uniref:Uncharacterized protein n=1 Tax=Candidatus Curtissbacteria bacterium RBG_13_40_7 TaxID=1797706 RepID=A0A1F5FUL7_9BACT|nr:MAG: hypothetical protein A2165_03810 [Candidatus Curtissbacteria bacterium RBG_13_40_7]
MKPSWKEILVIFVLAVLATGLSAYFWRGECPKFECPPPFFCAVPRLCIPQMGFPFHYYGSSWLIPLPMAIISFIADVLFYFFLFWLLWTVLKFAVIKIRHK